jgi:hypothetical protein
LKFKILIFVFFLFLPAVSHSQQGKRLIDLFGTTAHSYLLSATRPSCSVSPYTSGKNNSSLDFSISYGEEAFELPVSYSYGISNKLDVFAELTPLSQTYNFKGSKVTGFGDIITGVRYQFQNSKYFSHAVQIALKIPTANEKNELGTGLVDLYFGIAEGFNYKKFGYELSAELNFLRRRNLPQQKFNTPKIIQQVIDSLKSLYDYKYEPELVFSGGPSYDLSGHVSLFAGAAFSRNFKLDYNTLSLYSGIGILLSESVGWNASASLEVKPYHSNSFSTGISIIF